MQSSINLSRRRFIKTIGAGLAMAGLAPACSGPVSPLAAVQTGPVSAGQQTGPKTLTIMQWGHFVPAYKEWFDQYTRQWGEQNNIEVKVDYIGLGASYIEAAGQAAIQEGHDLIWHPSSPAAFETELVDMADVVQEIEAKAGPMNQIARNSTLNTKTGKQFGVSDYWVPGPVIWRKDLWDEAQPGATPDSWDALLTVGRKLKKMGAPLGVGISADIDSNMALRALLYSFGASVQNEAGEVVLNSSQAVEAVKFGAALFHETMTPEVLGWASSSNNSYITSGTGSLVLNAISAVRSAEKANPELAKDLWLAKLPAGPAQRLGPANVVGVYAIWKFAKNIEPAKKFVIDLILNYDTAFASSELFNFPSFPGAVTDFKQRLAADPAAAPAGKYSQLENAEQWSTNFGYPGPENAAISEVMSAYIIPKMFALAAQGGITAQESVLWAESRIKPIFARWRNKGLI